MTLDHVLHVLRQVLDVTPGRGADIDFDRTALTIPFGDAKVRREFRSAAERQLEGRDDLVARIILTKDFVRVVLNYRVR